MWHFFFVSSFIVEVFLHVLEKKMSCIYMLPLFPFFFLCTSKFLHIYMSSLFFLQCLLSILFRDILSYFPRVSIFFFALYYLSVNLIYLWLTFSAMIIFQSRQFLFVPHFVHLFCWSTQLKNLHSSLLLIKLLSFPIYSAWMFMPQSLLS